MIWRSGRDSNPRDGFPPAPLAGVCLRPLGHHSAGGSISGSGRRTRVNRSICRCSLKRTGGAGRPLPPRPAHPAVEKVIHRALNTKIGPIDKALRGDGLHSTNDKPMQSAPFRRPALGRPAARPCSRPHHADRHLPDDVSPTTARTHRKAPPPQALNRKCSTSPSCTS